MLAKGVARILGGTVVLATTLGIGLLGEKLAEKLVTEEEDVYAVKHAASDYEVPLLSSFSLIYLSFPFHH